MVGVELLPLALPSRRSDPLALPLPLVVMGPLLVEMRERVENWEVREGAVAVGAEEEEEAVVGSWIIETVPRCRESRGGMLRSEV